MKEIQQEESEYVPLPKFYKFPSKDAKERILYQNFVNVNLDIKKMIDEINKFKIKWKIKDQQHPSLISSILEI